LGAVSPTLANLELAVGDDEHAHRRLALLDEPIARAHPHTSGGRQDARQRWLREPGEDRDPPEEVLVHLPRGPDLLAVSRHGPESCREADLPARCRPSARRARSG